jgi:uncharacterized protein YjbI with pentapeptide repeats
VRLPDWLQKRKWLFIPIGVAVGVGLAVGSHYVPWPEGFGLKGKTLWDWLSLLGVPLSLALLGVWFQQREKQRDKEVSETQRKAAEDAAKEEVLQVYFDRISTLLVEKNLRAIAAKVYGEEVEDTENQPKEAVSADQRELLDASMDVIRARTLSILRRFDNDSSLKSTVAEFLVEAEIINKLKLSLRGADLSGANLRGTNLRGADLSGANLRGADLYVASLRDANLSFANLNDANLNGANLNDANLNSAELSGANLVSADLSGASLGYVDLSRADLSGADLSGASLFTTNLSNANLNDVKLIGVNLRDADLRGADLSGADLSGASLSRADVSGADLTGADLYGADLGSTGLWAIKFDESTVWPEPTGVTNAINIPEELR